MVELKCLKELLKDFILSFLPCLDIWVLASIVFTLNVFNVQDAISIKIDLLECLLNQGSSKLVHGTDHNSDKLIKAYLTRTVNVEGLE